MMFNPVEGHETLPCPFCGSEPKIAEIGNAKSKKRSTVIKCSNTTCRFQSTTSSLRFSHAWTTQVAVESWNRRHEPSGAKLVQQPEVIDQDIEKSGQNSPGD